MRIFFATDIHGSEKCFMKFVNAGTFYNADVLIMGGDMTGKAIVPIVENSAGHFTCVFLGRELAADDSTALAGLEKLIRVNGFYPFRSDPDEVQLLTVDESARDAKFLELMTDSIQRWVAIAEDRLRSTGIVCFMTPGNDDHLELDDALNGSDIVTNPEGRVVTLSAPGTSVEMISSGWTGPTPFETPRECSEAELGARITAMADQLTHPETAIFNLHNPPFDSRLDMAPLLDAGLRVQSEGGQPRMVPVGSVAVRAAIEHYGPLLSLHGHIHESRGQARIKRTVCLNPGSEYSEGVLRGAIVDLDPTKVKNVQLVAG